MWIIMFIKYLALIRRYITIEDEKRNITERDNYSALIYIILLSAGYSFEQIWMDIKNITTNEKPKFNKQFQNIFNSSKNFLIPTNFEAHKSSKINIIQKLFPKENKKIFNFFDDNLLNETKEIIRGMKNYFVNGKKDAKFKEKMNNTIESIQLKLKYLD